LGIFNLGNLAMLYIPLFKHYNIKLVHLSLKSITHLTQPLNKTKPAEAGSYQIQSNSSTPKINDSDPKIHKLFENNMTYRAIRIARCLFLVGIYDNLFVGHFSGQQNTYVSIVIRM